MTRFSTLAGLTLLTAVLATVATAAPREETIEMLDALVAKQGDESVRVLVNDGSGGAIRIGDELVYRFESTRPGYLTAIHVDTQGAATLLYPRVDVESNYVNSGQAVELPAMSDEFHIEAQPPVGRDLVYAFVTDSPISRADLGIESRDVVVSFEAHQAPALIRELTAILESRPSGEVRTAQIAQRVEGRGQVQYRSADIVNFFGTRTRSIRPAKLDLQVQFGTDSATLDDAARRNIDEFARALRDPKLSEMRFNVAGHTDSRGSEEHNMVLSQRRAEAVRNYLIETGGIESARLESQALGETNLLMRDQSDYARKMNRRVEFAPLR